MSAIADIASSSHPVGIECPACGHRFRVPLNGLSIGVSVTCVSCLREILIAASTIRQLLRQIDTDLSTPQDMQLLLRPPESRPPQAGSTSEESPSDRMGRRN